MQTLTIQITNNNALKAIHTLKEKHFIKIVEDSTIEFPTLPGAKLSLKAFRDWVSDAEGGKTVDLKEAKSKWISKRKQLQKLTSPA